MALPAPCSPMNLAPGRDEAAQGDGANSRAPPVSGAFALSHLRQPQGRIAVAREVASRP